MLKSPWRSVQGRRRIYELAAGGPSIPTWIFDYTQAVMTPNMAKRTAPGPFATAPIIQGKFDGSGTPDIVTFSRGSEISRYWYDNFDPYQGTLLKWWIPELDRDATHTNDEYIYYINSDYWARYEHDNAQIMVSWGGETHIYSLTDVAGNLYFVSVSADTKNTIDGTNFIRISINNTHDFGASVQPTVSAPDATYYIGSNGSNYPSNAIIEGLTFYRRVLTDGDGYGQDVGNANGDEIAAMYAAGAGVDPCLITGSWDVVFCLPTNSTAEELTTGTGEAWSHPHSSNQLEHGWLEDGGYLGDEWGVLYDASSNTKINCGSGATLDDIPSGAVFTAEVWFRSDSTDESRILDKGYASGAGWSITINSSNGVSSLINCATTDAVSISGADEFTIGDGKWHHVAVYYDDTGAKTIYIAIDGKWVSSYSTQTAGVGAYVSDAADDFLIGCRPDVSQDFTGCMGWIRLSNNARYTVGTDFVPPRAMPAADGNTIEQWAMNDGTGVTVTASVTSPGNDGTISNGTWERQWDQFNSPVIPYSVEFDGSSTDVDFGSAADIDDLADNAFTAEIWMKLTDQSLAFLVEKGTQNSEGWSIEINSSGNVIARVYCATTNANATSTSVVTDGKQHHIAITFDDAGDRKIRLYIDGILESTSGAGVGAIVSDASRNMYMGGRSGSQYFFEGSCSWFRISNVFRYSADFTPPSRLNPPGVDGNTIRQFNFRDGAGTTLTDATGTADGTIANGSWNLTPDMEIDTPGDRVYPWGYTIGVDAVDEGVVESFTGLSAGENYVLRPAIRYERDHRAQPYIEIWDDTNGAQITKFDPPWLNGTHDGGNNSATLSDSTAPQWPISLIGATVYNITDGSSATITAIAGNTVITAALAGGTDNDWDNGDEYRIFPTDIWLFADLFTFELPTIARNGSAADCTAISVRVANDNDEGVFYLEQIELLENLIDNPSLETGAGDPWIPDGFDLTTVDSGESVQELTIVHSGSSSLKGLSGWTNGEYIRSESTVASIGFYSIGMWGYGDGTESLDIFGGTGGTRRQDSPNASGSSRSTKSSSAQWRLGVAVLRSYSGSSNMYIGQTGTPVGDRYIDDIYTFRLDDVTLTVTPASQANSVETIGVITGLRNDGRDSSPAPITIIQPTIGSIWFKFCLRHDDADIVDFGNATPYIAQAWGDANNYISAYFNAVNSITLAFNDGGGVHTGVYATGGALAENVWYQAEWRWIPTQMQMLIDGVAIITIAQPVAFGTIPTSFYPGSDQGGINQIDAVFS